MTCDRALLAFAKNKQRVCNTSTRLYSRDSYLIRFNATVTRQWEESGNTAITLDDTAFYPTSGGQPHDLGNIGGAKVLDVFEAEGDIVHLLTGPVELGTTLVGEVNWQRRHDHMQQHTGQHILSQALIQVCGIPTIGFNIGPDWSTVALGAKPTAESLDEALDLANRVVDENRSLEILLLTERELANLPVRGELPDKEQVRIVCIEEFDCSPCGGTHSKSTGDVRLIVPLGISKEKDTYRLEFVCGRRAERTSLEYARAVSDVASVLDVGTAEVVQRTRASLEKIRTQEKTIADLREERLVSDCERILAAGGNGETNVLASVLKNRTIHELRQLAHMLVERPGVIALLVGTDAGKIGIVFARSEDRSEDMNHIMKNVCGETGCRGGGNAAFATGGGNSDVDAETVLKTAIHTLSCD